MLKIPLRSVLRLIKTSKIKSVRVGVKYRVLKEDLEAYINREIGPPVLAVDEGGDEEIGENEPTSDEMEEALSDSDNAEETLPDEPTEAPVHRD